MALTIVVGGQYGGEGKGVVTTAITKWDEVDVLVKTGGPNSAHTFRYEHTTYTCRMVPSGTIVGPKAIVFPAGCQIYLKQLEEEIRLFNFKGRVIIDPLASIITDEHVRIQKEDKYYDEVGSTLTGTGVSASRRARRRLKLARRYENIEKYLADSKKFLLEEMAQNSRILVEGCQGYGLSNYHGEYPYVSSRDNTVNGLMSQVGLGPAYLQEIILVIKCFPTRNAHGEATLKYELPTSFVDDHKKILSEFGGGDYLGGAQRRKVGLFDFEVVKEAIVANTPDYLAVTGLDKLEKLLKYDHIAEHYQGQKAEDFIQRIQKETGKKVLIKGYGMDIKDVKDERKRYQGQEAEAELIENAKYESGS